MCLVQEAHTGREWADILNIRPGFGQELYVIVIIHDLAYIEMLMNEL